MEMTTTTTTTKATTTTAIIKLSRLFIDNFVIRYLKFKVPELPSSKRLASVSKRGSVPNPPNGTVFHLHVYFEIDEEYRGQVKA